MIACCGSRRKIKIKEPIHLYIGSSKPSSIGLHLPPKPIQEIQSRNSSYTDIASQAVQSIPSADTTEYNTRMIF